MVQIPIKYPETKENFDHPEQEEVQEDNLEPEIVEAVQNDRKPNYTTQFLLVAIFILFVVLFSLIARDTTMQDLINQRDQKVLLLKKTCSDIVKISDSIVSSEAQINKLGYKSIESYGQVRCTDYPLTK